MAEARRIRVRGQVQGVGFRPFVWQLAQRFGIKGQVANDVHGVLILAVGGDLDGFQAALEAEAPPLARVDTIDIGPHVFSNAPAGFDIAHSRGQGADTGVTPDAATCPACALEIRDPAQRRHGHAFTNCTHCGPRFSILRALPYDRAMTSMAAFTMCDACGAEYRDPADRRFHAQPVACPVCGPRLWLEVAGAEQPGDPVAGAAQRLRDGEILAIKGLGGFHLACDATNADAIATLRARKHRPAKPLALMGSLDMIRRHAKPDAAETALLGDPAAPIVLLRKTGAALPDALAPGQITLGWMLPYTPLHHLLLDAFGGPLVMTSGNPGGAPQVIGNAEARAVLATFADAQLMHDRDILRRLDDSVQQVTPHGPQTLRRGRGRVPATRPLPPGFEDAPQITAYGGQMKSAICLIKQGHALLSHHLGDLDQAQTWDEFRKADADYAALFDHAPLAFACDLHDGYRSAQHAAGVAMARPLIRVQHHHAHLAACMADNLWPLNGGPVAGIILDGLGLGADGTIWGGELLVGDYHGFSRAAHLRPAPLPGGDAAQTQPWRNALMRLDQAGLGALADRMFAGKPRDLVRQAARAGLNAPLSSSAGRLFDAMAACLGLAPDRQSYEGEAAMLVQASAAQARGAVSPYPFDLRGDSIDPAPMFHAWAQDHAAQTPVPTMAARFQAGLARAFCTAARAELSAGRARAVALSGGCFQNADLLDLCMGELHGLPVLIHRQSPANDGGLALGQAVIAAARVKTMGNPGE